ncbi:MAG: shikimate dehydrogenase [Clostridia bacterium]|nr:shikimate dehydrogenase [Clostridia bacterium]
MEFGCIGEKLRHSFSKEIHEKLGPAPYSLIELSRDEVGAFMRKKDFRAINVTIPYKETVIPYLDYISETAHGIGAVNTVVNHGGSLFGFNTDFYGMTALIERTGITVKDKKVLILGTGGTSKTAFAVANALGARTVLKVSRSPGSGVITYEDAYRDHTDADIVINTTPVGMYPATDGSPIDIGRFPNLSGVIDAVYNPLRTDLILAARARGVKAEGGLYMLVAQAVKAYEFFNSVTLPENTLGCVYREILGEKQNIVLTGMPGSGKTTIGKILAKHTGRPFYDTDALIVKKAGNPVSLIFEEEGERAFRDMETETIRELSSLSGVIIATGGGAVLRDENVRLLKKNGRIYFRDRPLEYLVPTQTRPLASSREDVERRYRERIDIYRATADEIIYTSNSLNGAAYEIERRHFGEANGAQRP